MAHYDLIKNGQIVNTISADQDYIDSIRNEYDEIVMHQIEENVISEEFVIPVPPPASVSTITFKLLFTPTERVAIYDAASSDAVIKDWLSILDDIRLTTVDLGLSSTISVVQYLATKNLIANNRVQQILSGKIQ